MLCWASNISTTFKGICQKRRVSSPTLDLLNQNLHLNQKPDYLWTGEPWCIRTGPGFKSLSLSAEESRQIQKAAVGHTKEYVIETWILTLSSLGLWRWRLEADLAKGQIWVSWTGKTGQKVWIRDASWASHLTSLCSPPVISLIL